MTAFELCGGADGAACVQLYPPPLLPLRRSHAGPLVNTTILNRSSSRDRRRTPAAAAAPSPSDRRSFTISLDLSAGSSSPTVQDWVVKMTLPWTGASSTMRPDFRGMRFVDRGTGGVVPFWVETVRPGASAVVWLRVPRIAVGAPTLLDVFAGTGDLGDAGSVFPICVTFGPGSTSGADAGWVASGSADLKTGELGGGAASTGGFSAIATREAVLGPDLAVEAAVVAPPGAVPELVVRAHPAKPGSGIKVRMDTRVGKGGLLDHPFDVRANAFVHPPDRTPLPSNVVQVLRFVALGRTFAGFVDDAQVTTPAFESEAFDQDRTRGIVALMNHGTGPLRCLWIRAYRVGDVKISASLVL